MRKNVGMSLGAKDGFRNGAEVGSVIGRDMRLGIAGGWQWG